jgi:hypothetical protein
LAGGQLRLSALWIKRSGGNGAMSVEISQPDGHLEHVAVQNVERAAAVACAAVRDGALSVGIAVEWRPSGATRVSIGWPADRVDAASRPCGG